jgi:predicted AAA+ superfamily ATPase
MFIQRRLGSTVRELAQKFPVVALLGPRQSGKTTLAQQLFPQYKYVSFEEVFEAREFALTDPKGFLATYEREEGIILDEFQHVPHILSYIQVQVDREKKPGRFILTGSQNFLLNQSIAQSLAGRVAIVTLLPLSVQELEQANLLPDDIDALLFQGCYPRIYSDKIEPNVWFQNYIQTYIERDVRQIKNVTDLSAFKRFIQLCAGRVGQLLNVSALSNDSGIAVNTVNAWLSLLEQSYIIFLLQPHHKNFSKRIIKSPKLYFYDTGLVCSLLGIDTQNQVATHYLRGGLFESFVLSELHKMDYNAGRLPRLYFWRDKLGHEVDCIIERGGELIPIEIKAGKTVTSGFFEGLIFWKELAEVASEKGYIVYAGTQEQRRSHGTVLDWRNLDKI